MSVYRDLGVSAVSDGAAPVTAELWPQQGQEDCRSGGVEPERGGVYPLPISAPARVPSVHRA